MKELMKCMIKSILSKIRIIGLFSNRKKSTNFVYKDIHEAIKAFEEFNNIKVENYLSDMSEDKSGKIPDNYIGSDIFYNHIEEWIDFFELEDRNIFLKLLENYRYYTEKDVRNSIKKIINKIEYNNRGNLNNVFFITFPSKKGVKSGGDDLRSMLQIVGLGKIVKSNIIADSDKNIDNITSKARVIVFLDDIVGSGKTMYGNIESCINKLKLEDHKEIKIYVAVIYGREKKIKKKINELEKLGVKIEYILIENGKKCFDESNIFDTKDIHRFKSTVVDYENKIQQNSIQEKESVVLGYNKNQFLVSFNYNTPNNTLSNFWKPSSVSVPLFIRNEYIRPNIDEVRKHKENNRKNAYIMKQSQGAVNESK